MGATQRPTTTTDIFRALSTIDDLTREPGAAAAIEAGGHVLATRDDLKHVRSVICGLRDQINEAVMMATDHLSPRIYWRDGERWIDEQDGFQARMTERFPNLERLWIQTHQIEADAAADFGRKFPGRKVRF